jgi:hypothetical protein
VENVGAELVKEPTQGIAAHLLEPGLIPIVECLFIETLQELQGQRHGPTKDGNAEESQEHAILVRICHVPKPLFHHPQMGIRSRQDLQRIRGRNPRWQR